eukprot:tig00020563_g11239.t1
MCLHPADGPEPQHIEKAHASRRRGARAALPHAPALRKVIAKAAGGEGDPEAEALYSGHSWETPEDDVVTGAIGSAVAGCAAALLRLRAAYPDKVPALTATENKRVPPSPQTCSSPGVASLFLPFFLTGLCSAAQTVANDVFKKRNYALASLLYGVGLARCPGSERETRAALCGNLAEADLALGPAWAEEALLAAEKSLREAEAAGQGEGPVAAKARARAARARALIGAPAPAA